MQSLQEPDITTKFSFRGFSIKNGILEGLGKLKLNAENTKTNEICLKVNKVLGRDPIEIIGTFSNGTLNGNAKIVLHDGRVIIANYINGLSDGFAREWDKNRTLEFAGFYQVLLFHFHGNRSKKLHHLTVRCKAKNLSLLSNGSGFLEQLP